jgi:malonyl-CoA/methylmalonyl-CoA synthetase
MMGVPTFYTRLLADSAFGREDCRSMRLFVSGSAPLLASTHREFEQRTGHRILERYGMTETGMITSNPLDGDRVAGTVGFALPDVEVRIVRRAGEVPGEVGDAHGSEAGNAQIGEPGNVLLCEPGEAGVLEVRGPNVFRGYWRKPEQTAAELRSDGWFSSGDVATRDADGRITLVGRAKDLIISGGLNIYPKEIEEVLDACDGVAESAVVGVPDADFGEAVVAVVVAKPGDMPDPGAWMAVVRAKLARFKHPRRIVVAGELPRNAMGKVQKNVLRDRLSRDRT